MKRPWNRTNSSVYSLVTHDVKNQLNMNICTYVSVVNMNPRSYSIAIDYQTKTYDNLINNSNKVVLQALSTNNIKLIKKLGKQSGKDINKEIFLKKNNYLTEWKNHIVLKNTCFVIELEIINKMIKLSDHCLFLFKVKSFKNIDTDFLKTNDLIESKIIL
tara:strand:+ start:318 stop:797 length:480 start_codon:yes stop_codon:yes gene_type:complete